MNSLYYILQVPSDNAMAAATRNTSYEEQLLSSIKSRTGKDGVLPSLTSSPAVEPIKVEKKKAPAAVPVKKTVSETPRPSIGGKTAPADAPTLKGFEAPKPAAAPKPATAPAPAAAPVAAAPVAAPAAPSESSGGSLYASCMNVPSILSCVCDTADNKNAIVLGGVVLVAVAGIAVAGGNNAEGGDASSSAAPAAAAAPGVDPNVAEARAWIAAWKKKHGKA